MFTWSNKEGIWTIFIVEGVAILIRTTVYATTFAFPTVLSPLASVLTLWAIGAWLVPYYLSSGFFNIVYGRTFASFFGMNRRSDGTREWVDKLWSFLAAFSGQILFAFLAFAIFRGVQGKSIAEDAIANVDSRIAKDVGALWYYHIMYNVFIGFVIGLQGLRLVTDRVQFTEYFTVDFVTLLVGAFEVVLFTAVGTLDPIYVVTVSIFTDSQAPGGHDENLAPYLFSVFFAVPLGIALAACLSKPLKYMKEQHVLRLAAYEADAEFVDEAIAQTQSQHTSAGSRAPNSARRRRN